MSDTIKYIFEVAQWAATLDFDNYMEGTGSATMK